MAQTTRHEDFSENEYLVTHSVGAGEDGWRLDRFLKDRYRKRSRESIQRAIESGVINVQRRQSPHLMLGPKLKASSSLYSGDEVLVLSQRKPEPEVDFNYRLLFEDETIFVIEKPANLPVHPAGSYFFNTLLVHLKTQGHQDPLKMEREYYLVHRIDKETSGILVLAKEKDVCAGITAQFARRETKKRYLAIVKGVCPEEFEVDAAMMRDSKSKIGLKMCVAEEAEGAQSAFTGFKRLDVAGGFSLVECFPKTGRQHQIRVHLAHAGHPIVGDKLYGIPESEAIRFYERRTLSAEAQAALILPRHALHSAGLEFTHPRTGERMRFFTDLPADLRTFFDTQKAKARGD